MWSSKAAATRRDAASLLARADRPKVAALDLGERVGATLVDLPAHAILDRGRLIGLWEYDADTQEIVWFLVAGKKDKALLAAVEEINKLSDFRGPKAGGLQPRLRRCA